VKVYCASSICAKPPFFGLTVLIGLFSPVCWSLSFSQEETGVNTPSDPFASLQAALNRHRVHFLKNELALCLTFSLIAIHRYETGDPESAVKSMGKAEKAYEAVRQVLSDPRHSKHLTDEVIQDITLELKRLRGRLDEVRQRFKN
jgi:hypothetical protein